MAMLPGCATQIGHDQIFEALTKDYPNDASFWYHRGCSHADLSLFLVEINQLTKADEQLRMAAYAYEQACRLDPHDHRYPNSLATLWLNSNNPTDRSKPEVVEFARKARDMEPGIRDSWNILGAAFYYAGDWKAAAESLETSLHLRPTSLAYRAGQDDCFCRFFLAMAQWKLNNKTQARHNYDLAVKWMNENMPDCYGVVRFRDRAAEVLGIATAKDAQARPAQPDPAFPD